MCLLSSTWDAIGSSLINDEVKLTPFYKWKSRGSERANRSFVATQQVRSTAGSRPRLALPAQLWSSMFHLERFWVALSQGLLGMNLRFRDSYGPGRWVGTNGQLPSAGAWILRVPHSVLREDTHALGRSGLDCHR